MVQDQENKIAYPEIVRADFPALGTEVKLFIRVESLGEKNNAQNLLKELKKFYQSQEQKLSRFLLSSELSAMNSRIGEWQKISPLMRDYLERVIKHYQETEGIFDPRVLKILESLGYDRSFSEINSMAVTPVEENFFDQPLQEVIQFRGADEVLLKTPVDFSGIAKGRITDQVAHKISAQEFKNFLVDSGGDIVAQGNNEQDIPWHVALEGMEEAQLLIKLENKSVATSGIGGRKWEIAGKRVHHLVNPKNPKEFDFSLRSVTVVADDAETADVWAKTLFILGQERAMEKARENNLAAIIFSYQGGMIVCPAARKYVICLNQ